MIEIRQEIKLNNIYWIDMLKYSKNNDETRDNPVYHMYDEYVFVIGVITYFLIIFCIQVFLKISQ